MAEKSVVFSLKVNTGNSVNDIQAMDKAVVNFNNDLKTTQTTAAQGTGVKSFEDQLNSLDARLKAGGLSIRDTTKLIKEFQTVALQAGSESPIGSRAVASASKLKDQITDLNNRVRLLSSDTIKLDTALAGLNTGAAVFQGMTSAIALTGLENEDLQKTMVKLQAVQGVTNAISTVTNNLNKDAILGIQARNLLEKASNFIKTGSIAPTLALAGAEGAVTVATTGTTLALKALRIALLATGIGAIVVAVGLLVTNFDLVKNSVIKAFDSFNKLGTGVKTLVSILIFPIGAIRLLVAALESLGIVDNKNERDRKANSERNRERIGKEIAKNEEIAKQKKRDADAESTAMDNNIRLLEAQGKSTVALRIQQKERAIDEAKNLLGELELNLKILQLQQSKLGINVFGDLINETNDGITEQKNLIATAETDIQLIRIEAGKKAIADKKSENKEKRNLATVDINQIIADEEALDEQLRLLTMTDDERALDAIQEKFFKLRTEAENAGKSIVDIDRAEAAERKVITDKAAAEELAADKLLADERVRLLDSFNGIVLSKTQQLINDINAKDKIANDDLKKSLDLKLISQAEFDAAVILQAQATAAAIDEVNKKSAQEVEKTELVKRKAVIDTFQSTLELAQSISGALDTMREISNAKELQGIEKGSEAEKAILKKQFEEGKKAQLATAFLNALQAQVSILGQYPKFDGGFAMVAAMAGAAITSAATIAKIKSTKFDGGGSAPGGPDPGLTAATFSQVNTDTQTSDLTQQSVETNQSSMVQVSVLEFDITNVQNKVSVQEVKSSF